MLNLIDSRASVKESYGREIVWIIGDGRSGTSWLMQLLNHDGYFAEMMEPFHPDQVPEMSFLEPMQYIRPGTRHRALKRACDKVFSGALQHPRVSRGNVADISCPLLVKDIFANLFSYWAFQRYENMRVILMIRNPFAALASKLDRPNWYWLEDPATFQWQGQLAADILRPFDALITTTLAKKNRFLNLLLIWCVVNYVPLTQFARRDIEVVFFEELYNAPTDLVGRLRGHDGEIFHLDENVIRAPSEFTDAVSYSEDRGPTPIDSWKLKFSEQDIEEGNTILAHFGMEKIYSTGTMPDRDYFKYFLNTLN